MADDKAEDDKRLIRDFIAEHTHGVLVDDDEDLLAGGYVNSLFAVQMVLWVERTFGIRVDGADLDFANFSSVDAVAAFVAGRRTPAGGAVWTSN
ncbi:acyl carrier protein [Streptomyces sp. NBC_00557]|uniref:acyl carrier protein n=1 Tax=Streptomyces sp. NBC_00557 TaxID=2975776 RepID=UPI002E817C03|nr:phosphopantetheine-binding protein [Streptomyces sp. NBC_00557]WUC40281.1 phosphopantetheine-binding protein [Streptomyces sp. NBC_00557]